MFIVSLFPWQVSEIFPLPVTISNIEQQTGALASQATLYTYFYTNDTLLIDFKCFSLFTLSLIIQTKYNFWKRFKLLFVSS